MEFTYDFINIQIKITKTKRLYKKKQRIYWLNLKYIKLCLCSQKSC